MDPALTTEAAVTPAPQEPVVTEPAKPLDVAEFVHQQIEKHGQPAAEESGTTETPAVAEAQAAETAVETTEPQKADATQPPFTVEDLGDPAFLGRLDKDGWSKLETFNPALYKAAKAVAHAQGTVFELKRRLESQVQAEPQKQAEPAVDPYEEALAKTDSLDATERAEGFRAMARIEARKMLDEAGIDPVESNAVATERAAFKSAVLTMPTLAEIPTAELDAAVEADPDLMDDLAFSTTLQGEAKIRSLSKLIVRAGKIVVGNRVATKAAADAATAATAKAAKDTETQNRLRSNQTNASTTVAETPGGKSPKGDLSMEEFVHAKVAALPH